MPAGKKALLFNLLLLVTVPACSTVDRLAYDMNVLGGQSGLFSMHQLERSSSFVFPVQAGFWVERPEYCAQQQQLTDCEIGALLSTQMERRFPRVVYAFADDGGGAGLNRIMEYTLHVRLLPLDQHEIRLVVLETATGRIMDVASISVRSGLDSLGSRARKTLLNTALGHYVQNLAAR